MVQLNSKRIYSGSDLRHNGVLVCDIEPMHVILFTACGDVTLENLAQFTNLKAESKNFYREVFRWDQKLHVVGFQ